MQAASIYVNLFCVFDACENIKITISIFFTYTHFQGWPTIYSVTHDVTHNYIAIAA